jgi:hypothetical protein
MNPKTSDSKRLFQNTWLCLLSLLLVLLFAGCQRRDEVIAGVVVPVPPEMHKVPDKAFDPIPGFEAGQASFEGKVAPGEIYTFYQQVMQARGWRPEGFFAGEKDQIAYAKGNKTILITYSDNADGNSDLTIMVGPGRPTT